MLGVCMLAVSLADDNVLVGTALVAVAAGAGAKTASPIRRIALGSRP